MKILISVLAFSIFLFGCSHNTKMRNEKNYTGHPIIGSWSFDIDGCIETYDFLPDGTRKATSGQELVKATYIISESNNAMYKQDPEKWNKIRGANV